MSDEFGAIHTLVAEAALCGCVGLEQRYVQCGEERPALFACVHVALPGEVAAMEERKTERVGHRDIYCQNGGFLIVPWGTLASLWVVPE